jgi:hypothetical protein
VSEWPKWAYRGHLEDKPPVEPDVADEIEVIPADLGRELYEAALRAFNHPEEPSNRATSEAIARYEREVGE